MTDIEYALRDVPVPGGAARRAVAAAVERAAAAGLADVAYAHTDTPIGRLLVAVTPRGLVRLAFPGEDEDAVLAELARRVSPRVLAAASRTDAVRRELDEFFAGRRRDFDVPVDWSLVRGFALRVLHETARIPYGTVTTYRELAARAGNPAAPRATGGALGSNPVPVVVPCHRVVRTGGALGGYGGGLDRKDFLLRLEGAVLPVSGVRAGP